jgi:hypothetical protein
VTCPQQIALIATNSYYVVILRQGYPNYCPQAASRQPYSFIRAVDVINVLITTFKKSVEMTHSRRNSFRPSLHLFVRSFFVVSFQCLLALNSVKKSKIYNVKSACAPSFSYFSPMSLQTIFELCPPLYRGFLITHC